MKLLICDDDITTIDFIQSSLNCHEFGITKLLRAYNGIVAKEIINAERPELILCDIGMPQCDGIEVLKYVSQLGYQPEFTFLTCYRSFEYVRVAMRYGAANFLTKPVNLIELHEALRLMLHARERTQKFAESSAQHSELLMNSFLRDLCDGMYGAEREKIAAAIRERNLELEPDMTVRCVLANAYITTALQNDWDMELLVHNFHRLAQEIVAERQNFAYSFVDISERFITVTLLLEGKKVSEQEVMSRCESLLSACKRSMTLQPVCLVGEEMLLWQLSAQGAKLQRKLHKIRLQSGRVRLAREDIASGNNTDLVINEAKILDCIKRRDKAGYISEVSFIANKISLDQTGNDCAITLMHHDLIHVFNTCLCDNEMQGHAFLEDELMRELDGTAERSVFDMMNFAVHLYEYTVTHFLEVHDSKNVINKVKHYIAEHYHENINRDSVAASVFVTPNYLSKRFVSEVGMNLREYINQLRIKEAKRLLLSTDFAISKIASDVGFENISYFSTVFRKQCGMSPADWRGQKDCEVD